MKGGRGFLAGILAVVLVALIACSPSPVFEQEYRIDPERGWAYENVLNFTFSIQDTLELYDLFLDLGHATSYNYENLYIRLHTIFPDSDSIQTPLSLELANKAGEWYGSCGRHSCEVTIPLQENIRFNQPGVYKLLIEQFMRQNPIMGVEEVGLRLHASTEE